MPNTRTVSEITRTYLCNSCGACAAACPENAITYRETPAGYLFPRIAPHKCTSCGLCYRVCPGKGFGPTLRKNLPRDPFRGNLRRADVGKACAPALYNNAQSGGVCTALVAQLFDAGAIDTALVAVMKTSCPPRGDVMICTSKEDLHRAQKSKYTPIPMLKAIKRIQHTPGNAALVGLSCHMHGLSNLQDTLPALRKKTIYRIGLICDRILLTSAVDFYAVHAEIPSCSSMVFRDKNSPSYPGNIRIENSRGDIKVIDKSIRMRTKDLFTPIRCRLCFDKLNVFASVVCGDPHGLSGIDRTKGETLVLTRDKTGEKLVTQTCAKDGISLRKCSLEAAVRGQKITEKEQEWTAWMNAWDALGMPAPHYGFTPVSTDLRRSYCRKMQTSLKRAAWARKKMIHNARRHLLLRRLRSLTRPFKKLFRK
ncbi:MAG: Coenzyme F420 hydrogenase/dehydrogenase, beta subunit C-terminal domain [Fibrobacterota bacterium]